MYSDSDAELQLSGQEELTAYAHNPYQPNDHDFTDSKGDEKHAQPTPYETISMTHWTIAITHMEEMRIHLSSLSRSSTNRQAKLSMT